MSKNKNPRTVFCRGALSKTRTKEVFSPDPAVLWLGRFESTEDIAGSFDDMNSHYSNDDSPLRMTHKLGGALELATIYAIGAQRGDNPEASTNEAKKYLEIYHEIVASLPGDFIDIRGYRDHSDEALLETHESGLGWEVSTMQLRCKAIALIASSTLVQQLVELGAKKPSQPENLEQAETFITNQLSKMLDVKERLRGEARKGAVGGGTELALQAAQFRHLRQTGRPYWLFPSSTRLDWAGFQSGGLKVDAVAYFPKEGKAIPIQYKGDQQQATEGGNSRVCVVSTAELDTSALSLINAVTHSSHTLVEGIGSSIVEKVVSFGFDSAQ